MVSRYIELNPVRAQIVKHPSRYPWSSFHANALGVPIKLITPHHCYQSLGKTKQLRQESYLSLFDSHLPDYLVDFEAKSLQLMLTVCCFAHIGHKFKITPACPMIATRWLTNLTEMGFAPT